MNGGSEAIKGKLKSLYNWSSSVASVAAKLDADGNIAEWQLHIFGKTKGAKLDANTFFVDQEEGNYMRIQEMALETLTFRGSMVSEWISPEKYHWEYRLPHESDPKKYYRVKEGDMAQYKAMPLWVRASCQVSPAPSSRSSWVVLQQRTRCPSCLAPPTSPSLSFSWRSSLCLSCLTSQLVWVWAWGQSPS